MLVAGPDLKEIVKVCLLIFWLTACLGDNTTSPVQLQPGADSEVAATTLSSIGAEGSTVIANAPAPALNNEAVIDTVDIMILESFPVQVNAVIKGKLPDGCVKIERISRERSGSTFLATIITTRQPDAGCIAQLQPFEQVVPLDVSGLAPGAYTVTVGGANTVSTTFQLSGDSPPAATATLPPATIAPNPTALPPGASISGIVWADFCQLRTSGSPSVGCRPDGRGSFRADGIYSNGEVGLAGVQVTLNRGGCAAVQAYAVKIMTDTGGFYFFGDLAPGPYCVVIEPQVEPNRSLLLPGDWSYPAPGVGRAEVSVGVGESKTADFGWDRFESPRPGEFSCTDQAAYVTDLSIPDNTPLAPGAPFVKSWRVRNTGSCAWGPDYALVFVGGEPMGGETPVPLPQPVQPGSEIDLSIALVAPTTPGVYRGEWKLQNRGGITFGSRGNYPFYAQIVVSGPDKPPELTIRGVVWEDFCRMLENGSLSDGCVLDGSSGAHRADGLFNHGEHGLTGVEIKLSVGECPGNNFVFTTTTTDAAGAYRFPNLQAGPHCLSIDPLSEPNASILLPGAWTYPAPDVSSVTVVVGAGQNQTVDFGWDYQLR
jgi:hypothetical protein